MQVRYQGLRLIATRAAMREMAWLGIDMHECQRILDFGTLAPRKRARGTEEKWLSNRNKTYNVVVVLDHSDVYQEKVWAIIHVGMFGKTEWDATVADTRLQ